MNFRTPIVLIAAVLSACASGPLVPIGDPGRDASLKEFRVPQSTAAIYIFRSERTAWTIRMDVLVDGQEIGATAPHTYLYAEVNPGRHTVTSKAENVDSIEVDVGAGSKVFIWQEVKLGFNFARSKLHLVTEEQGKLGVLQSNLTIR